MRFAFALLPLLLLGALRAPEPVAYTLAPEMKEGALQALSVEVRYAVGPSGVSDFAWADHWGGERALSQWARDLKVEGAASVEHPSGGLWRIKAQAGAPVVVRYRIVSAYAADPTADDSEQPRPVIRPHWFYSTGHAVFGAPRERLDGPASFRWAGEGSALRFASDLEHLAITPGTVREVRDAIVTGAEGLRVSGDLGGADRVRVAEVPGRYAFGFEPFQALARRIVKAERGFFGEGDEAPFLITLSPLATGRALRSLSGTGLGDAFALWVDDRSDLDEMTWLIAHEYFHTWNAARLGGFGGARTAGPVSWFSEGFTDYYARALLVRARMITPEAFVRLWNRTLRDYAASPVKTAPNTRIATDFWNDPAVEALPYQRGAQLAALWNRRLRERTGGRVGLDDVVLAQYRWVRDHPGAEAEQQDAPALFVRIAGQRFGLDLSADVERYVTRGEAITLPAGVFGPCAALTEARRPVFDRGYDSAGTAKAGNRAQGVKAGSTAYAAGLRDGMTLLDRTTGEAGDPDTPYTLEVDDGGTRRTIRYLPRAAGSVMQRSLNPVPGADPKGCARSLSGL